MWYDRPMQAKDFSLPVSESRLHTFGMFPWIGDRPVARLVHTEGYINTKRTQTYFHDRREIRNHDPNAGAIGGNIRQKPCSHFVHNLTVLFLTISKRINTQQYSVPFCHYKHFLAFLVKQIPCLSPHPLSKPNFHILQCPIAISVLLAPCQIFLHFLTSSSRLNINIFFKHSKAYDNIGRPENWSKS